MHLFTNSTARILGAGAVTVAAQRGAHWHRCRADDIALWKRIRAHELLACALAARGKSGIFLSGLRVDDLRREILGISGAICDCALRVADSGAR
jgi:hypothetical protein